MGMRELPRGLYVSLLNIATRAKPVPIWQALSLHFTASHVLRHRRHIVGADADAKGEITAGKFERGRYIKEFAIYTCDGIIFFHN